MNKGYLLNFQYINFEKKNKLCSTYICFIYSLLWFCLWLCWWWRSRFCCLFSFPIIKTTTNFFTNIININRSIATFTTFFWLFYLFFTKCITIIIIMKQMFLWISIIAITIRTTNWWSSRIKAASWSCSFLCGCYCRWIWIFTCDRLSHISTWINGLYREWDWNRWLC